MRDNQGRELLVQPTTMALAFMAARAPFRCPAVADMVLQSLLRGRGKRKTPAWTVTRKGAR